ncbi:hypothetical protein TH53_17610 [Pedobacter lusitanus]|uniref:Uncharacterized protein n=1 Tax=Pedobacter lusitanus TaxID=1503925 RepID=A0A0D0GIQ2_9SPHI|nr:hypothetical protein [Pedobacter lusitanus]KIO75985.1 hypothetical protein TH53_17610 [Pedobacter lusitanus]
MTDPTSENLNIPYTTVLLPLTEEDKQVIEKELKNTYQGNFLLLPLLVLFYFFGLYYFLFILIIVLIYNIFSFSSTKKNELSLNNPKIILTGKITKKEPPGDGLFVFMGQEKFELTYANITYPIEVGDTVSLHYSQFDTTLRGILLGVEKEN